MTISTYRTMLNEDKHNVLELMESCDYPKAQSLDNPEMIVEMMCEVFQMDRRAEEYAYILAFDSKQHVTGVFELSHGTVNEALINPRDIFIRLLLAGAVQFVLIHNHPSGIPEPSREDILITKRIGAGAGIIGVDLADSIIIGDKRYVSFRERGLLTI